MGNAGGALLPGIVRLGVHEKGVDREALAKEVDVKYPGAAGSLREGLEQTLAVLKLGLPAQLRRGLRTTDAIEALSSQLRATVRRVSRFTIGDQALRRAAGGARLDEATARAS